MGNTSNSVPITDQCCTNYEDTSVQYQLINTVLDSPPYHLIFVQIPVSQFRFALFLKCYDDQSDEDVDKEEGENNEVDHVEKCHFSAIEWCRTLILLCGKIELVSKL